MLVRSLSIAVQADPLTSLRPESDSTLFIAAELCRRQHQVLFYTPDTLRLTPDGVYATGCKVEVVHANSVSQYKASTPEKICLNEVDAVLIRQDPPFNMDYINSTYILEMLQPKVVVLNDPKGLRNNPEKLIPLRFPGIIPPTIVLSEYGEEVLSFIHEHQQVVLKPLYGHGGNAITLLSSDNVSEAKQQVITHLQRYQHVILQRFLPAVREGDKRIMLLDGKIAGVIKRVPPAGDIRTNLAVGGKAEIATISAAERQICETIKPHLQKNGLLLAGIDVIDDYLIEVNVTSPTGLVAINNLCGIDIASQLVNQLEKRSKGGKYGDSYGSC